MKKFLICLLALCLLVPFLAACDDKGDDTSANTSGGAGDAVLTTPVVDLDGREVHVLCNNWGAGSKSILGYTGEIMYAEENPSAVDEAKKQVLDHIEATYNCTVEGEIIADSNTNPIPAIIEKQVTSGAHYYDVIFDSLRRCSQMAVEQQIIDLNSIESLDLSKAWWDQNAVADLSLAGKNYFVAGDINNYDDQGTWCVLFNKNLKSQLGLEEDFYALARDGEWTNDKFMEICTSNDITTDLTGEGTLDELDRWAFGTETYNIYVQLVGGGQKIAQKDDDDLPYLTVSEETTTTYSILGDLIEFYNNDSIVMVANNDYYSAKFANSSCWEETVHRAFIEGRELFYMCGLINVASFRQMEDEFGILPIPKYYDTQDRYYHTVSIDNASFMAIPVGTPDLENLGTLLSAIGEMSKQKVTPAYYDIQLKYRDSRDDESGEMLDIIFASRTFDIGCAYNWGSILSQYMNLDPSIASRFESVLSSAESAMEETVEAFK